MIAEGFTVEVVHREEGEEGRREWKERRFMVLSPEYAEKQRTQLEKKIEKAEAALKRLARRRQGYHYPKSAVFGKLKVDHLAVRKLTTLVDTDFSWRSKS